MLKYSFLSYCIMFYSMLANMIKNALKLLSFRFFFLNLYRMNPTFDV
jgi:hypothetical protein